MSKTDVQNDINLCHPKLIPKVLAVLRDVGKKLPKNLQLVLYETARTAERQAWLFATKRSKVKSGGKHQLKPAEAADVVFKYNGTLTWNPPPVEQIDPWHWVESSKRAHNLRIIGWDKPHCELKKEDK